MPPKKSKTAPTTAEEEALQPYLGRELRVELNDGRVLVGVLLAYEGSGDLMLQGVVAQCHYSNNDVVLNTNEKEVVLRTMNMVAVPFQHVRALHRRKEGVTPLIQTVEQHFREEQEAAAALAK